MSMKNLSGFIPLMLGLIILGYCGCTPERRLTSLGPVDEVSVVTDQSDWELFEPELRTVFEKEITTPGYEKLLNLQPYSLKEFLANQRRRNLVFLSTLESSGETMQFIKKMLHDSVLNKVASGQSYFFQKKDPWATNQLMLILVGNNPATLKQQLLENKNVLFDIFDTRLNNLVKAEVYGSGEQHLLAKQLLNEYGWALRIQHDFQIFRESQENQFVMLLRDLPKRWFLIRWIEAEDPTLISKEWCVQFRNEIYGKLEGAEKINEEYLTAEKVEFPGQHSLKLTGIYEGYLEDGWPKGYGGPFRSYFTYIPEDKRIYMIDYAMFAPDREKVMYLRQLDIMANTFYTKKQAK